MLNYIVENEDLYKSNPASSKDMINLINKKMVEGFEE